MGRCTRDEIGIDVVVAVLEPQCREGDTLAHESKVECTAKRRGQIIPSVGGDETHLDMDVNVSRIPRKK